MIMTYINYFNSNIYKGAVNCFSCSWTEEGFVAMFSKYVIICTSSFATLFDSGEKNINFKNHICYYFYLTIFKKCLVKIACIFCKNSHGVHTCLHLLDHNHIIENVMQQNNEGINIRKREKNIVVVTEMVVKAVGYHNLLWTQKIDLV